jgi:hypothetical protein
MIGGGKWGREWGGMRARLELDGIDGVVADSDGGVTGERKDGGEKAGIAWEEEGVGPAYLTVRKSIHGHG